MRARMRLLGLLACTATVALGMGATEMAGAVVSCGETITQSTKLLADVGPCANNGIIVGADYITLNLNGYRVFGTGLTGDGAGVLVKFRTGVTVTLGKVTDFDGGVVVLGGGGNTVSYVEARDNIGASAGHAGAAITQYADGILIQGSVNNKVLYNTVDNNGWSSGIGLIPGDSDHPAIPRAVVTGNLVQGNTVTNSQACRIGPFCDNDGIRVEPWAGSSCLSGPVICPGPGNRIVGNTVINSSLDGISLFGFTTNNLVADNVVKDNGYTGAAPGDGIRVFGSGNNIIHNQVDHNRSGGVSVGRRTGSPGSFPASNPNGRNNTLTLNSAQNNAQFDLWDSNRNPDCDNNAWRGNVGGTAAPACTRN